jgi:ankyrin repeat protein
MPKIKSNKKNTNNHEIMQNLTARRRSAHLAERRESNSNLPIHKALYKAIEDDNIRLVKLLIKRGGDVKIADSGLGVLYPVVCTGNIDLAKLLIKEGACAEYYFCDDGNLLHTAAEKGYYKMAELLIQHGADINARDGFGGYSPFYKAVYNRYFDLAKLLFSQESIKNLEGEMIYEDLMGWLDKNSHVEFKEWILSHI